MRIKSIRLSWFRGAADPVALVPDCKSMVVYGANGSGKSCFVDAVEYVLEDGKIKHLAHEYSGRKQEKAIVNTHKPKGQQAELDITFQDDSEVTIRIAEDGSHKSSVAESVAMPTWDYRRTVLRQHEVVEFIQSTKGDKYSALLPLLGLQPMEVTAENLRQLAKSVEQEANLTATRIKLQEVKTKRAEIFGTDNDDQILKKITDLHTKYCKDEATTTTPLSQCKKLKAAIDARIADSSADQRRYVALQDVASLDLKGETEAVRTANGKLAGAVEPLITEKLEVLKSADALSRKLVDQKEVICPACGRVIPVHDFQAHVAAEQERLRDIINSFDTRKAAIGTLCTTVRALQSALSKSDLRSWRDQLETGPMVETLAYLSKIDTEALRASCEEQDLSELENGCQPLIDAAISSSKHAPPDAQQLSTDGQRVDVARTILSAKELTLAAKRAETLISFIHSLERGTRDEIKVRAQTVISEISADVQTMWGILHPGESIEDVRLHLPDAADKAIDIGLKFHGVGQDSPRLTLSEGYRNGLGLCIFLAMAKREAHHDRPVFLDDVVVCFDRDHRGMIAEILEREFSTRQVIILTHDRDWYTDLRAQLDHKTWRFGTFLPYETPDIGIRWSHKSTTFDDARALLKERPDAAGNDARKIMDVELAIIAERLQIRFPFLRGDKNDKRMAHDFLERLASDGKKCFQKRVGADYGVYTEGLDAIGNASRLLVSWANRASHTYDLVRPEAAKLIDACETALACFKCPSCDKRMWLADAANPEWLQCQCGELRWRYGKGS